MKHVNKMIGIGLIVMMTVLIGCLPTDQQTNPQVSVPAEQTNQNEETAMPETKQEPVHETKETEEMAEQEETEVEGVECGYESKGGFEKICKCLNGDMKVSGEEYYCTMGGACSNCKCYSTTTHLEASCPAE